MTNDGQPAWLKIMEHGAAGEARTKAFLLDRFWVLERSVDIDGADFLIQPRSLADRFTDRAPPKIGVVQAKYFQDPKTTHYVPCRYVLDDGGLPLKGFFAVLHLGREDAAEMFLLSAADIVASLEQTADEPPRFTVGAKALDDRFRVKRRRQALDRMAHELSIRSSLDAFRFLDQVNVPYRKVSAGDIEYIYTLPIPNAWLDIAETYYRYRDQLRFLTFEMEEALVAIDTILKTPDPRVALGQLKKLDEHRGAASHRDHLTFGVGYGNSLDWSHLEPALKEHEKRVGALQRAGMLEAYVDLSNVVRASATEKTQPYEGVARQGHTLWAGLDYDPATLAFRCLEVQLLDRGAQEPAPSRATTTSYLFARRDGPSLILEASDLWHGLMNEVLEAICPGITKDED